MDPAGDAHAGPFQQAVEYWGDDPGDAGHRFQTYTGPEFPRDGELQNDPAAFRSNTLVSLRMARAVGWEGPWACA